MKHIKHTHHTLAVATVIAGLVFGLFFDIQLTLTPADARANLHSDKILPVMPTFYSSQEIAGFYPAVSIKNISFGPVPRDSYTETGDLASLQSRGFLRILDIDHDPSLSNTDNHDRALVHRLADDLGLTPLWIRTDNKQQLIQYLQEGRGDIIINTSALYLPVAKELRHSVPLRHDRFELVTRRDRSNINSLADMKGRNIALRMGSPLWSLLEQHQDELGYILVSVPDYLPDTDIINAMRDDKYDAVVLKQERLKLVMPQFVDVIAAFSIGNDIPASWMMRNSATALNAKVNAFLMSEQASLSADELHWDDLANIKERGVLRIITRPISGGYMLKKGQPVGFEYSLIQRFSKQQGLRHQVLMAEDNAGMLKLLSEGLGDVIIAPVSESALPESAATTQSYSEDRTDRWILRAENKELQAALNEYLAAIYKTEFYNVTRKQFARNKPKHTLALSPYDELIQDYAEQYHFDWRLIVAQMYQESHFDRKALSDAGAVGLMQVLPSTGRELGFSDLNDPASGIHAGTKYLHRLRERFKGDITVQDLTWFSLAAYNAGFRRVQQARGVAIQMGLDENRWFGHVEEAMREMNKKDSGMPYCNCGQTVIYVRNISQLFSSYVQMTKGYAVVRANERRQARG